MASLGVVLDACVLIPGCLRDTLLMELSAMVRIVREQAQALRKPQQTALQVLDTLPNTLLPLSRWYGPTLLADGISTRIVAHGRRGVGMFVVWNP